MTARRWLWPMLVAALAAFALTPIAAGTAYAESDDFYTPLAISSGFNIDGVKEDGAGARYEALDTANATGDSGFCYFASVGATGSLPLGGVIQSSSGKYYKLAKYNANNVLRLSADQTDGTLSFDQGSALTCKSLSLLVTGGAGGGTVDAIVDFDGTEQTVSASFTVPDWAASVGDADALVYRCGRYSLHYGTYALNTAFGLYECTIDIPAELQGYAVTSLELDFSHPNGQSSTACFFAVSAVTNADICTTIFDENGGTLTDGESGVVLKASGETITLPGAERARHTFAGWYDGEVRVGGAGDSYVVAGNVVLRAQWTEVQYVGIYVQGAQVTSNNWADVLGDKSVSFDPDTMTLTLKDANLAVAGTGEIDFSAGIWANVDEPITIHLEGENEITASDADNDYVDGIYSRTAISIEGPGSLSISLQNVETTSVLMGIESGGSLTVNADLDMSLNSNDNGSLGLNASGDIVFDDTRTNITVATNVVPGVAFGIETNHGGVTVKGDSDVRVNAGVGMYADNGLDVQAGSRLELVCSDMALPGTSLTAATEALGVQVKYSVDADDYEPWDGRSLNEATCVLIPGKSIVHVKAKPETCGEAGTVEHWTVTDGDETKYYADVALSQEVTQEDVTIPATGEHVWDDGKVTKEPTATADGVKTYTCTVCGETKTEAIPANGYAPGGDPNQMGTDGTAVGPGASAAAADKAITSLKKDADPKGSAYLPLKLKSSKQAKSSVKVSWTKAKGATKYVVYGNKCGKSNKMKQLATTTGASKTFKKVAGKKVKKGTAYKFIVVALDKNGNVVSTSKMVHAYTKGGKYTNHKSITMQLKSGKKYKKAKSAKVKVGKTARIRGVGVKASKAGKYKSHVKMRYESSNTKVATVSSKGVIKGKAKGTCYVWAYSQNGVGKKIKVVVK